MSTLFQYSRQYLYVAVSAASLSLSTPAAYAQDKSGSSKVFSLEEVVVTATRTEENLNSVPVSVTAVSGDQVDALGAEDVGDIQVITPNFNVQTVVTRPNDPILVIRGLLKRDGDATLDTAVGVYADEVFLARGYSVMGQLLDVDRIEVLRGPQGTLFGRNTIGGAVQVISRKPEVGGEADGYVDLSVGNYDMYKVGAASSFQLFNGAAMRLAGKYHTHSGYTTSYLVDDTGPNGYTEGDPILDRIDTHDADEYSVRASFVWEPTDNTSIDASAYRSESKTNGVLSRGLQGDLGVLSPTFSGAATSCAPGGCGVAGGYSAVSGRDFYKGLTDVRPNGDGEVGIYIGKLQHHFENFTAKFIASFAEAETQSVLNTDGVVGFEQPLMITDIPLPASAIGRESFASAEGDVEQSTFELQFSGDLGYRANWIAGLYYFEEEANDFVYLATSNIVPNGASLNLVDVTAENDSSSVYGSFTYDLTEKLKVRFGARYTEDSKGFTGRSRTYLPASGSAACAFDAQITFATTPDKNGYVDPNCRLNNTDDSENFTWDVSLDYQLTDDVFTYAKVGTGYRTGGISLNAISPETAVPFKEDEVLSYELGVKADIGLLAHVNASLFYTDYSDIQQNVISSSIPNLGLDCAQGYAGAPVVLTCNVGDGVVQGVELEAVVMLTDSLSILGAYGYTDVSYDNSAFETVFLPESTYSISANYDFSVGGYYVSSVLSYQYSDEYYGGIPTGGVSREFARVDGYSLLNARLNIDLNDSWRIALWGKNLTEDEYYANTVTVTSPIFQVNSGIPGAPRTYGIDLKYDF